MAEKGLSQVPETSMQRPGYKEYPAPTKNGPMRDEEADALSPILYTRQTYQDTQELGYVFLFVQGIAPEIYHVDIYRIPQKTCRWTTFTVPHWTCLAEKRI